jgi:hypothetical protein
MGANSNHKHDRDPVDPVAFVNTIMDHLAQEDPVEADTTEFAPEEDRWARRVRQGVDTQLAALRRQLTPVRPKLKRLPPIPDEIRALDHEGLLARLEILREGPGVRYAHMDLTGFTTDDLRQMVAAILEPPIEE